MLFEREYKTLTNPVKSIYTDKGSRFLAFAFPVKNEESIRTHLSKLKNDYPDATHHCYAWILNPDKSSQRINDDGEPSNTAGRPILKQINALNLTNILVVVVRYFGGKKLGIPGLIEAYGQSAHHCLAESSITIKTLNDYYTIICDTEDIHLVYNLSKKYQAEIITNQSGEKSEVILAINGSKTELFTKEFEKFNKFEIKYLKTE